jgi:hypothetical protein
VQLCSLNTRHAVRDPESMLLLSEESGGSRSRRTAKKRIEEKLQFKNRGRRMFVHEEIHSNPGRCTRALHALPLQ